MGVLTTARLKYLCIGCTVEAGKHLVNWKPEQSGKSPILYAEKYVDLSILHGY